MRLTSELKSQGVLLLLAMLTLCSLATHPLFAADIPADDAVPFTIESPFAWNRTDRYVPPDFDSFFPDDIEGGKQLDLLLEGKLQVTGIDARLALIRRGLRHCTKHRTTLLGQVGNQYIWNREQQDPRAIELMYHASASDDAGIAHYAMYHGPTVVSNRSANLVRMLMKQYPQLPWHMKHRIAWGMRTYGDKEQTRKLLSGLLDDHSQLNDLTVGATLETWQAVFETDPPELERFDDLGLWIIAFHRPDVSATHPRAAEILRKMVMKPFGTRQDAVLAFLTRVDEGYETAIVLVKGLKNRRLLENIISKRMHLELDCNELFTALVLQTRRLNELAHFLPEGSPRSYLPDYTRPPVDANYAYEASEYVAPDYEAYFADDPAAGKQLDDVYAKRDQLKMTDAELLELFRQGLRHSRHSPNVMIGWFSQSMGWPRDPRLTEILYQALDPKGPPGVRKAALYYGFGLGTKKTKNVLRALYHVYMASPFDATTNHNMRTRILWGVRDHEDDKYYLSTLFAEALREHEQLTEVALEQAVSAYRQLTGGDLPNLDEYAKRGVYVVMFGNEAASTIAASKANVAERLGDSERILEEKHLDEDSNISVIVLVRGSAGMDWLIKKLQTPPKLPIYFAGLLTPQLIEQSKPLKGFEKYLPAEGPREE